MSDSTSNIASPTPDEKDYKGTMTKEEYENRPESNTGATVERDVDEPNPKVQSETPEERERRENGEMLVSDQVAQRQRETFGEGAELTKEQQEQERKHQEIMDAELNQPKGIDPVVPQNVPVPADAQEKHAEAVSEKQRSKLDSNTKPAAKKG